MKKLVDIKKLEKLENELLYLLNYDDIKRIKKEIQDLIIFVSEEIREDKKTQKNEFKKFVFEMMKNEKDEIKNKELYKLYKQIDTYVVKENETYFNMYFDYIAKN